MSSGTDLISEARDARLVFRCGVCQVRACTAATSSAPVPPRSRPRLSPSYAVDFADQRKRVGLIGCGWYGKTDLFRLLQVAPVEVVSLCDVDKLMLADAIGQVSAQQESKKKPRGFGDYREMLKEKHLDAVLIATPEHWHVRQDVLGYVGTLDSFLIGITDAEVLTSTVMSAREAHEKRGQSRAVPRADACAHRASCRQTRKTHRPLPRKIRRFPCERGGED